MNTKTLEERQAEKRETFLQSKKQNREEVERRTKYWNYRKEGDLYPKIPFAFNVNDDEYQILQSSVTNYNIMSGKVKEKEINQYTIFEQSKQSFESNLASQRKVDPGIKIITKEGEKWNLIEIFNRGLPKGIKRTSSKSSGRKGRGRSWSKERVKITKEAVEHFDSIFVIEFKLNKGGESGGRNSKDKEWNNFKIKKVYKLNKREV